MDIIIKRWVNPNHGMELAPDINTGARNNENGVVFYATYIILKYLSGYDVGEDLEQFYHIVDRLQAYNQKGLQIRGIYDRGAKESLEYDREVLRLISHDNLSAISSISGYFNFPYAEDIWNYGKANFMLFDNAYPEKPRVIYKKNHTGKLSTPFKWSPRDWCYWAFNAKSKWWFLLFLPFFIMNIITCMSPVGETSGKQLVIIRLALSSKKSKLMWINWIICKSILRAAYGKTWAAKIMGIYYKHPSHPIHQLANALQ